MNINTNQIVSISEANQNFSRVARIVDKAGSVIIFKNNKPKYRLSDIEDDGEFIISDEEKIGIASTRILRKYKKALEELAK